MKVINVCGFNLSGCTAAFDLFSDYRDVGSVNREYHETGFLKCKYSFGGAIQSVLLGNDFRPTASELKASLLGEVPADFKEDINNLSVRNHLCSRQSMLRQYGSIYQDITHEALTQIPENIASLSNEQALSIYSTSAVKWIEGVIANVPAKNFPDEEITSVCKLLFKNDPPAKFPYMASLIPNGTTIAVLRDPYDACFDFNRFYKIDSNTATVTDFCMMLASWIRTAINQIKRFGEQVESKYYVVKFEDLVGKPAVRKALLEIVGLETSTRVRHKFCARDSIKNVGISKDLESQFAQIVTQTVMPDYVRLIALLETRGMLVNATG